ncbi:HET-domain-containing protein [Lentinus tigrinus ALCF2SS1-7]|uniref:HET-domain-containing protein n=1 Tax=Lentinus tigrinus ALCF2SS1-7 TaxID=1328758 RepID=UPI001165F400|nr:HET-domain-containing protein [Lentinus tigrinus ALCF2SS1-7]
MYYSGLIRLSRRDMWLLNTENDELVSVNNPRSVRYAALSHMWSKDPLVPELSFHDLRRIQEQVRAAREKDPTVPEDAVLARASPKICSACAYARDDGIGLLWADTCCIDKSSSAELGEAINSMYSWYSSSTVCYVFLHDVDG